MLFGTTSTTKCDVDRVEQNCKRA